MTIGQRAAMAIKERAWANDTRFEDECDKIGIDESSLRSWTKSKANPSAYALAKLDLQGYDIHYILTGERK
jgi:hypothetical protein